MHIRPLYDRILVKRVEQAEKSAGGLFLPENAKEKPSEGVILAVGHGRVGDNGDVKPLMVKEGDRIVFGRYAGNEVKIDGNTHLILREDEVFGIVEN